MLGKYFYALILLFFPCSNAFAYLDPGSGGMLLQLLFGGVAGGLAIIKLYWSQIKQKLFGKKEQVEKPLEENSAEEGEMNDS